MHHKDEKKMYLTDPMSRQIQHQVEEADDIQNKQITVITAERICMMTSKINIVKDNDLLERIR